MIILKTIVTAFSYFSRIPMPNLKWDARSMRYMLCAFPLIGLVIGLLVWGWMALCRQLELGAILFAAVMTSIPIAISGGIHLDGFCDTCDALASHADAEKKREILKDPRMGAFGGIGLAVYLLLYFALCTELEFQNELFWLFGLGFMLTRCLSGFAVLSFPAAGDTGMLFNFKKQAAGNPAVLILLIFIGAISALMVLLSPICGGAMLAAALLCLLLLRIVSQRQFGGMSGDLAGWFLQIAELAMLAVLIFTERGLAQ